MVAFPSEHGEPSGTAPGDGPRWGNWRRSFGARVGLMRRSVPDRRVGSMSDGVRSGEVYLRSRVGGVTELVVESPGYRQVICEATPAMEEQFAATLRGE